MNDPSRSLASGLFDETFSPLLAFFSLSHRPMKVNPGNPIFSMQRLPDHGAGDPSRDETASSSEVGKDRRSPSGLRDVLSPALR